MKYEKLTNETTDLMCMCIDEYATSSAVHSCCFQFELIREEHLSVIKITVFKIEHHFYIIEKLHRIII